LAATDHLRKQIRDQVVTALTGLTTTGARCTGSSVWPTEKGVLPALRIYTRRESAEISVPDSVGEKSYQRDLDLVVEGRADGTDFDDQLDQIALEVEGALEADVTLGGLAWDIELTSTEVDMARGDKPIGSIELTYRVRYHATAADPSTLEGG